MFGMNFYVCLTVNAEIRSLQLSEEFSSSIQMVEPGYIQVMLPPVDLSVTNSTWMNDGLLEGLFEELVLPTRPDAYQRGPPWSEHTKNLF